MMGSLRSMIPARWRPIEYLTALVQKRTGSLVAGGPFEGTRYPAQSHGSAYIPKLLGIYERELAQAVEAFCAVDSSLIVDVGAAEGYYAVGMARRNPGTPVVAFEMEDAARGTLQEMAEANGVAEQISVRGRCEPEDLADVLDGAPRAVVICDTEGYERELLDPVRIPALRSAHVLVELHEFVHRGIGDALRERFEPTHEVVHIEEAGRQRAEFPYRTPYTALLPGRYLDWAVSEWRPEAMDWLWMTPRTG